MMIARVARRWVEELLSVQAAVALLGPRQVGKTTLARAIGETRESVHWDLENPEDAAILSDPRPVLARHAHALVIVDEVQRSPRLFEAARGVIDEGRRSGRGVGRFLFLGLAAPGLLRQASETLAGPIAYRELGGLLVTEVLDASAGDADTLWLRGGFPESFLAADERVSLAWRRDFIRTYLERDIAQFDSRIPAETLRRLWTMLAHNHGGLLQAAVLARSLAIDVRTVGRYLDLLVDLLLARRLPPWSGNVGKRLVRSPKLYVRDSGVLHALLGLSSLEDVLGHAIAGASWEGFVIENVLAAAPSWVQPYFYRTSAGAEVDLVLEFSPSRRWAIEIKLSSSDPRPSKGFHVACEDLAVERRLVVYPGTRGSWTSGATEFVPLVVLLRELLALDR